jgi:hypothetical protein
MGSMAICLDQNQNTIACADPDCTYGDCCTGIDCYSVGAQQTTGPLCLDQNQNQISCSDPNCTYGDCTDTTAGVVGHAAASNENGGTALTTPSVGGATGAANTAALANAAASLANTISTAVTGPPKTTLTLGASGLSVSSLGSIFSNPLMLILLAVIAALMFGLFKKRS